MKIQTKLAASILGIVLLMEALLTFELYTTAKSQLMLDIKQRLSNVVGIAALNIDTESHKKIRDVKDESRPEYRKLKKDFQAIRDTASGLRFVYSMRMTNNGKIEFVIDAEEDPKQVSHPGDIYEDAGPVLKEHFSGMTEAMVENDFYTDRWGTWLTGYAPFKDKQGNVAGILGMDISAARIEHNKNRIFWVAMAVFAATIPFAILFAWLLGRRLARPIIGISESAKKIAAGNLEHRLPENRSDEIGILSESFNTMAEYLVKTIKELANNDSVSDIKENYPELLSRLEQLVDERANALEEANMLLQEDIYIREKTEAMLVESEQRLRILGDNLPGGVIFQFVRETDGQYRFSYMSAGIVSMLGITPESCMEDIHAFLAHLLPEDLPLFNDSIRESAKNLEVFDFNGRYHDRTGQIKWVRNRAMPHRETEGRTIWDGFALDVTDNKQAEDALKNSERQLLDIINFLPDPTLVVDDRGFIIAWNRAIEELTRISADRMLGKGDCEYAKPFYGEPRPILIDFVLEREAKLKGNYNFIYKDKEQIVDPNEPSKDAIKELEATARALYDNEGRIIGAIESFRDVTDKVRAKRELANTQALFSGAIEQTPAGIIIADAPNAKIRIANSAAIKIGGLSERETSDKIMMGKTPRWDILTSDGVSCTTERLPLVRAIIHGEVTTNEQWIIRRPDGEHRWVLINCAPVRNGEGEIIAGVAVFADITEGKKQEEEMRKAKEDAEEATQIKSDFLANMSHEIRTPMNAVIGLTDLTLKTKLSARQVDYLSKVRSSAQTLLGIINDVLDFSKIEAGKMEIENIDFDLNSVLENVTNMHSHRAAEKGIEFILAFAEQTPTACVGDPLRIEQILNNLTSNAVKFADKGEVVISVSPRSVGKKKAMLEFSVRDTGIGLSETQVQRLFSSFTQADSSTTRKYGGTGLGLAISKTLVELMGGEIRVKSEQGQGSDFRFTVPVGLQHRGKSISLIVPESIRNLKTLVVDDNDTTRLIIRKTLESFSMSVETVSSGAEALVTLSSASTPFDLVLMDWKMPGLDGISASSRIKNDPKLAETHIIMMTAFGRQDEMKKAERIGIDAFLIKPINPSSLFDTIMEIFGQAPRDRESSRRRLPVGSAQPWQLAGSRALLVEDNYINQQVATEILESATINVTTADNGKEALDILEAQEFDVVLMDVQMPLMDGFEATRRIREISRLQNLPVIAMTAHAMEGDREKCLAAGMNDYVSKPIDTSLLFEVLQHWVTPSGQKRRIVSDQMSDDSLESFPSEIDGIKVDEGLARLGGKAALYRKLLIEFADSHKDSAVEALQYLKEGSLESVSRIAHTLKGVAGNISAHDLSEAARMVLESCDIQESERIEALLSVLDAELTRVLNSIETLRIAAPEPDAYIDGGKVNWQALRRDLRRLGRLLDQNDLSAEEQMKAMLQKPEAAGENGELKELEKQISGLDFENARRTFAELMAKIDMDRNEEKR